MFSFFNNFSLIHKKTLASWVIIMEKIWARGLEDHPMFKWPIKNFRISGLRKEKVIFNQQNKACLRYFVRDSTFMI